MQLTEIEALELWRRTIVAGVRHDVPDLSARQMAVLLTVYLKSPPHTVRGLASALNISKPAITRSLDRLSDQSSPLGRRPDCLSRTGLP